MGLLVLQKTSSEIPKYLDWLDTIIKEHEHRIAERNNRNSTLPNTLPLWLTSYELLEKLNVCTKDSNRPNFLKFEEIKNLITSIAGLYHKDIQ